MRVPVVHIITMLELGGAQENTLKNASALDPGRYHRVLICGEGGPLLEEARSVPGMDVYVVPELVRDICPLKDLRALIRITLLLRRIRKRAGGAPVIAHTHSSKAGIVGRWAAFFARVPFIVHTVHGFGFNDDQSGPRRALFVWLERITAPVTDFFIAVAEDNVRKGVKEKIFTEDRTTVIRSGIDTAGFARPPADLASVREAIGVPADAPMVTMVSCLKPQKAPVDFVRVAARVLDKVPDAHFVQAGDGELREECLAEAARLGISERYRLLGWRRDVREIIHASDVIVLTSLWEGLPRVVPEAMSAGKPVVATAVDGTPEAVKDGVNGFLLRMHDVEGMASKIITLLADKEMAARMGRAGRGMADEFDEGRMLSRTAALYETLLKEASS